MKPGRHRDGVSYERQSYAGLDSHFGCLWQGTAQLVLAAAAGLLCGGSAAAGLLCDTMAGAGVWCDGSAAAGVCCQRSAAAGLLCDMQLLLLLRLELLVMCCPAKASMLTYAHVHMLQHMIGEVWVMYAKVLQL